jgi:S-adenosylmethionine hydrolase
MKKGMVLLMLVVVTLLSAAQSRLLVLQTDFGVKDGAVAAMKGVAMQVDKKLQIFDLTHEIPAYNIWEAAYRLDQVMAYWPAGTVFVSVVDPGVGSERKSVVLKTNTGHYVVTPDNGTLTLITQRLGIAAVRQIDEKSNRLPGSADSYTFHGRDVFAYTAARLASGNISFNQVGPLLPSTVVSIPFQKAVHEKGVIKGNIPILDVQYGNVWTNIPAGLIKQAGIQYGDSIAFRIYKQQQLIYEGVLPYVTSFSAVPAQQGMSYLNSLLQLAFAINMGDFAARHHVGSGPDWTVEVRKYHGK